MSKKEEDLFEGINFGDMFSIESDEPIEDADKNEETDEEQEDDVIVGTVPDENDDGEDTSTENDNEDETLSDESDNSSSSSNYQVFAQALYDEGVLSSFKEDSKIESADDLINTIREELKSQQDAYKDSMPDLVKTVIEKYEEGVDIGKFLTVKKEQQDYSAIKEDSLADNEKLTKEIIKRDLLDTGYSADEADDEIADIFELGKEEAKAKRSLKRIKSRIADKEKDMELTAKLDRKAREDAYKAQLKSISKVIDDTKTLAGVEVTGKVRKDALKAMTEIAGDVNGTPINAITKSRLEDPMEFDKNVGLLWVLTNGFKDWSKIQKVSKRKAIKDLENVLSGDSVKKPASRQMQAQADSFYPKETFLTNIKL